MTSPPSLESSVSDVMAALGERDAELLVELRVPSCPDRLRLVRAGVSAAAQLCGFGSDDVCDIVLAVDEACQNVIRHAYKSAPDGVIVVALLRDRHSMIVLLRDFAPTVDASRIKPRSLDEVRPGGIGVHLINEVMDESGFLPPPSGHGNLLRMAKRFGVTGC
ncbi:MAG: ATP-binding protein [Acetobacterales bacterium]